MYVKYTGIKQFNVYIIASRKSYDEDKLYSQIYDAVITQTVKSLIASNLPNKGANYQRAKQWKVGKR